MESGHDKRCAKCNAPAKNKCSRCKSVVYCDKNCQSSHWHQHQMTCNKPGQVIQRAGEVLQRLFLVWREHALSRSWDEICDTGELVVVHELPSSGSLHSFPYHLVQNDSQKEMVISADYCTDFVGRFGPILGHLIKRTGAAIREVTLCVKKPKRRVIKRDRPRYGLCHTVLEVTCNTGKKWFIDGSGAQFGIFEPCLETRDYMARYGEIVLDSSPVGIAAHVLHQWSELPGLGMSVRQSKSSMGAVIKGIETWELQARSKLSEISYGPEHKFKKTLNDLLEIVANSVKQFANGYDNIMEVTRLRNLPRSYHEKEVEEFERLRATDALVVPESTLLILRKDLNNLAQKGAHLSWR